MTPNRTMLRLAAGVLVVLLAAPAFAQDLQGFQLFAPADISPYGRGPQPNQGYFFSYDELYWSISPPKTVPIGDTTPKAVTFDVRLAGTGFVYLNGVQVNGADTGTFDAGFAPGPRIEFGRVVDHQGWFVSVFKLNSQTTGSDLMNVPVNFRDPFTIRDTYFPALIPAFQGNPHGLLFGPVRTIGGLQYPGMLPVVYSQMAVRNEMDHWGVEMNYLYRTGPMHNGSFFEFFLGPRYFEFNDTFDVDAQGGALDYSFWHTSAENHIVGGQVGVRWFKKYSRFTVSAEGRGFGGYNSQNFKQDAVLGGYLPFNYRLDGFPIDWTGSHSTSHDFRGEWVPAADLRVDFRYQLTRSVSLRAGYNAFWADGIARACSVVKYEVPNMGIDASNNRQGIFVNGISIGVDINR